MQGKRPRKIMEQQAVRKSPRLHTAESHHEWNTQEVPTPLSPPASNIRQPSQKRKRGQEEQNVGRPLPRIHDPPFSEPLSTSILPSDCAAESGLERKRRKGERASDNIQEEVDPLHYWTLTKRWPKGYFESDNERWEDIQEHSSLEEEMERPTQVVQYVEMNGFRYPRPIRKVPTSVRRKQSDSSLNGSSNGTNRENKSAPYATERYTTLLAGKGSYMHDYDDDDLPKDMDDICTFLLKEEQSVPQDSLFRSDLFKKTCRKIADRNEARVVQDITRLIVPSAETLATYGAKQLDQLIEGVNEAWSGSIPVEGPPPKPDYSVGFRRSAFTSEQLKRIDPFIGTVWETSYFVATYRMYFPFLTCEVKCGASALDIADRQNAHSMTVAVRALVELFRLVKREKELDREILAFSVSHDHRSVRIYGHYPVIERDKTTFYRHPVHEFSFTTLDGRERWTTHKFVKNIYDHHSPKIHKLICSVIDDLPADITFEPSQAASFSQSTSQSVRHSNSESVSGEDDSHSSLMTSQGVTPTTSFTQTTERASKKPRN